MGKIREVNFLEVTAFIVSTLIMIKKYTKESVLQYLNDIHIGINDARLIDQKVRMDIVKKIDNACKITNLSVPDLLLKLDFKPKDLTIEALESFLAELRSIYWLQDFAFTDIIPLKASMKNLQSDFTAKYKDKICAVEVFCLTQAHEQQKDSSLNVYKNFNPNSGGSKFGRDFISIATKRKKLQLDSMQADVRLLLCVLNSQPVIRLNSKNDMENCAKFLYEKLLWGQGYYLGILTGLDSDVIFPSI